MDDTRKLVGSIIDSFLGPNKSNKLIVDGKDFSVTRCPLQIFHSSFVQDPLSSLIEETLLAHHDLYGCSTFTLLAMWYLWFQEFKIALEEGSEMQDLTNHSQDILELVISSLSDVSIDIDSILRFKKQESVRVTEKIMPKALNVFGRSSISVLYTSRHFSPSSNASQLETENEKYSRNTDLEESCMKALIKSLDHDEDEEMCNLLLKCWKRQIQEAKSTKFKTEGIIICPFTLPHSNCAVLDGLLVKSSENHSSFLDMKNIDSFRSLIINGSITYEHVHLGFSPKVSISSCKTFDSTLVSEKEKWREKCCKFISQLRINILFVRDDIDPVVKDFCFCHSTFVLHLVPLKFLKALCHNLQYSPCTYIWDCDEKSVIKNLTVKKWESLGRTDCSNEYFLCNVSSTSEMPLQTIILCHPSQAVLDRNEHQMWHLVSRLELCFQSKKLLPGGEVEKWCSDFLLRHLSLSRNLCSKTRAYTALANGFLNYSKIVRSKKALSTDPSVKIFDEMSSKLSAWRSSLSLVLLALQCDYFIVNGIKDTSLKETGDLKISSLQF